MVLDTNIYITNCCLWRMKKGLYVAVFIGILSMVFASFLVSAVTIDKVDKGSVIIKELGNPAVYEFIVTTPIADTFEIYSFVGARFSPRGSFDLPAGTSSFEVKVYPEDRLLDNNGFFTFEYQLIGQETGITTDTIRVKFVSLAQVLSIEAQDVETSDSIAQVKVENTQNAQLDKIKVSLNSPLFSHSETLTLGPFEVAILNVSIDADKQRTLPAGQYVISGDVTYQGEKAKVQGTLEYVEEEKVSSHIETRGSIIKHTTIAKTNEGNTEVTVTLEAKRDALSRLFTTFSREPISSQRTGFGVVYIWEDTLEPGESTSVTVATNYTFPLIALILIIVVIVLIKRTTEASVNVKKQVSFVKTKGGEFALKVTLTVSSDKHVENIQLIDSIPGIAKLYHQYGKAPDRVDAHSRRLFWDIDHLNAGEARLYSYIIYSTIRVVGKFELPAAVAVFEKDGKTHEVYSNRAFFATENMQPGSLD